MDWNSPFKTRTRRLLHCHSPHHYPVLLPCPYSNSSLALTLDSSLDLTLSLAFALPVPCHHTPRLLSKLGRQLLHLSLANRWSTGIIGQGLGPHTSDSGFQDSHFFWKSIDTLPQSFYVFFLSVDGSLLTYNSTREAEEGIFSGRLNGIPLSSYSCTPMMQPTLAVTFTEQSILGAFVFSIVQYGLSTNRANVHSSPFQLWFCRVYANSCTWKSLLTLHSMHSWN